MPNPANPASSLSLEMVSSEVLLKSLYEELALSKMLCSKAVSERWRMGTGPKENLCSPSPTLCSD